MTDVVLDIAEIKRWLLSCCPGEHDELLHNQQAHLIGYTVIVWLSADCYSCCDMRDQLFDHVV